MPFLIVSLVFLSIVTFIGTHLMNLTSMETGIQMSKIQKSAELEVNYLLIDRIKIAAELAEFGTCPPGHERVQVGSENREICWIVNNSCVSSNGYRSCLKTTPLTSNNVLPQFFLQQAWASNSTLTAPRSWGGAVAPKPLPFSSANDTQLARIQVPNCAIDSTHCFNCADTNSRCFSVILNVCQADATGANCVGTSEERRFVVAYILRPI